MPSRLDSPAGERAISALFVVLWSTGFIVARFVAPHAEPLTFLSMRFIGSSAALALLAVAARATWPRDLAGWRDALVAGALLQGLYLGCIFWAVHRGLPAGIAALISSLQPLATALLAPAVLGETVSGRRWAGIGLGFVGAALVLLPKLGGAGLDAVPAVALVVALAGMLAITFGTFWQKRRGQGASLLTNASIQFLGGAGVAVAGALALEPIAFDGTWQVWAGLAWAILVLSVGSNSILLVLIKRGAVTAVASLFFLVPAVSAAMAFAMFGERLDAIQLAGMAVAVAGVALASRG